MIFSRKIKICLSLLKILFSLKPDKSLLKNLNTLSLFNSLEKFFKYNNLPLLPSNKYISPSLLQTKILLSLFIKS